VQRFEQLAALQVGARDQRVAVGSQDVKELSQQPSRELIEAHVGPAMAPTDATKGGDPNTGAALRSFPEPLRRGFDVTATSAIAARRDGEGEPG
jgi:hypothetical protein